MVKSLFLRGILIDWEKIDSNSYLREIPALRDLNDLSLNMPATFFVGENGSGKSTLLEAIAVASGFNPEGGTQNYHFSTCDTHSDLWKTLRLIRGVRRAKCGYFFRSESFYNVATQEIDYADAAHPSAGYHERSHGEGFLAMAQNYLRGDGLYFLDEPEAALSPQRQLTLLAEIQSCIKQGAQFIIATHSPILLGLPHAAILSFDGPRIRSCAYEETESYRVMKLFINQRDQLLSRLLAD